MLPGMPPVSRRAFLAAPILVAIGASVAGCTTPPAPVADDPDRDALTQALATEEALLAWTKTWDQGSDLQKAIGRVLNTHVATLTQTLGSSATPSTTPSPSTSAPSPFTETDAFRRATLRAAAEHTKASRDAEPQTAQLLASLAASDAAIATALGAAS
jgi:hypothetical protein